MDRQRTREELKDNIEVLKAYGASVNSVYMVEKIENCTPEETW